MRLIKKDQQKRIIHNQEKIQFSSFSSWHLIIISARAKSEKQLGESSTDDEDLTVQIDGKTFPKLGSNSSIDSPAAFSGGRLHNLAKTVYFLTYLQGKDHKLILNTDNPPGTATFEKMEIYTLDPTDKLTLEPKIQAEDGDRRPWITFVLDNIPIKEISVTITYSRRKGDSDDVKIIIDGKTQGNVFRTIKNFLWYFAGSLIPLISPTRTETQVFTTNFSAALHYIELDADRMPILENITLNFGNNLLVPKHVPTVNDPEWTGNFDDDTEIMILARLIFGEARNQSEEAMKGVGWVVKNRSLAHRADWGDNYHKVIRASSQFAAMNPDDKNFPILTDPLNTKSQTTKDAWRLAYKVAQDIINDSVDDSTGGALFFHSADYSQEKFTTKDVPGAIFTKQIGDILFYKK